MEQESFDASEYRPVRLYDWETGDSVRDATVDETLALARLYPSGVIKVGGVRYTGRDNGEVAFLSVLLELLKGSVCSPVLCDFENGFAIRDATPEEDAEAVLAAKNDGGVGAIVVDGRRCFVNRVGDAAVSVDDICSVITKVASPKTTLEPGESGGGASFNQDLLRFRGMLYALGNDVLGGAERVRVRRGFLSALERVLSEEVAR